MGRHVRKRKGSAKVAVMEKEAAASRKRKLLLGEPELSMSSSIQLKTQRSGEVRPENSASPSSSGNSTCESGSSGHVLASCCSSTVAEESTKFADLKENEATVEFSATTAGDLVDFRDSYEKLTRTSSLLSHTWCFVRREKTGSSEGESTESNSRGCSAAEKIPTEAELEEFFAAAETNLQRQFIDKYNYDIAKDKSLEGRYEWVQVQLEQ